MPGEADMSHPIKWAQVIEFDNELDEEDMEMANLMCAIEDCTSQLQFLTGWISKYMDNMEVSADKHYNYIATYLGGLQKQLMVALMAIQVFIDQYWDEMIILTEFTLNLV